MASPPVFDPKDMKYRRLGNSGLKVSVFSYGGWLTIGGTVKGDPVKEIMKTAWEAGVNFFDNAEVYSAGESERQMGRAIKELGWNRSDYVITTKIWFGTGSKAPNTTGLSRKHILEGLDASLERLQLSHVDIVLAHQPDPDTPMEEIVRAFSWAIEHGKTHYWGTSEWNSDQILHACAVADRYGLHRPIVEQPQYSMLVRDRIDSRLLRATTSPSSSVGTMIWSPLASGILTGKYNDGIPTGSRYDTQKERFGNSIKQLESEQGKANIEKVKKLTKFAEDKLGCSVGQLALAWAARNRRVTSVILGATNPEQLKENLAALPIIDKLTPEILEEIEAILDNKPEELKKLETEEPYKV